MNYKQLAKNAMMRGGGGAAGGVAAFGIDWAANKFLPNVNPNYIGVGEIVLGAIVPEFAPKQKILDHVGSGMCGAASNNIMNRLLSPAPTTKVSGTDESLLSGLGASEQFFPTDSAMNGTDDPTMGASDDYGTMGSTSEEITVGNTTFTS
ncbi:MAG: hypothetical protein HXX16_17275 [Bacteroidales bacterium]|nr:hypothetical protein [Bacteroidales bacterium]